MNVDAFVRFAVNETGENTRIIDYQANDLALTDYFSEFASSDDINSLICFDEVLEALKSNYGQDVECKNKLILATFTYKSFSSFNGEHMDYDDETSVVQALILDNEYKGTWQKNLTTMYNFDSLSENELAEKEESILEWEEFYDEDFEFFKPEKVNVLAGVLERLREL